MSKVVMQEPVAFLNPYGGVLTALTTGLERETFTIKLITTDQAEAYATAKVREALEEAAEVADRHNEFATYDAIRALIPKENT